MSGNPLFTAFLFFISQILNFNYSYMVTIVQALPPAATLSIISILHVLFFIAIKPFKSFFFIVKENRYKLLPVALQKLGCSSYIEHYLRPPRRFTSLRISSKQVSLTIPDSRNVATALAITSKFSFVPSLSARYSTALSGAIPNLPAV